MSEITLIPYNNYYYINHRDEAGNKKCLGKVPAYCLQTAIWFYTLENMDVHILEDNMDAIDDYFEQKMKDIK
jgi:hypothetical protein